MDTTTARSKTNVAIKVCALKGHGFPQVGFLKHTGKYYVTVRVQGETKKTAVSRSNEPIWNETFIFNVPETSTLRLRVFAKRTLGQDYYIGGMEENIQYLLTQGGDGVIKCALEANDVKAARPISASVEFVLQKLTLLVIGEFVAVLYYCAKAFQLQTYAQLVSVKNTSMSINVLAAAGDVLIAIVLCSMLQKSRTGFKRSDTMINKLIIFTMNTGLLTSLCAVASLVSILAAPNTFIYIGFFFCMGRLYSNTLMATLNARQSIRGAVDDTMTVSLQKLKQAGSLPVTSKRQPSNIAIKVDTVQEYSQDHQYEDREFLDMDETKINREGGKAV